jgi:hypothetical protein
MQLYRYFVSQPSEFCRHNLSCSFSTSNTKGRRIFLYRLSSETFGCTLVRAFVCACVCVCIRGISKSFRTKSIKKYTLTTINTRWEATQGVMAAKLTRMTHKVAIQLHLVAESCTICSSRSRRPVRKLLNTPSCVFVWEIEYWMIRMWWGHSPLTLLLQDPILPALHDEVDDR